MVRSDIAHRQSPSCPLVTSVQDLERMVAYDPKTGKAKYTSFCHITPDDELYFGTLFKDMLTISIPEYNAALRRVPNEEIYPEAPKDSSLTLAADTLVDGVSAYVKRPGLSHYESFKGTTFVADEILHETTIMEKISKTPHPHIIRYFGCRIRQGRITSIFLELHDHTLQTYSDTPEFKQLDKSRFLKALWSAVDYIHSLGLAHNDITPMNIMVKNGMPVLIDFGSCAPFGESAQSLGSPGWREPGPMSRFSEKKHDEYSLRKIEEWFQNPISTVSRPTW